jgi:hypothetical protein
MTKKEKKDVLKKLPCFIETPCKDCGSTDFEMCKIDKSGVSSCCDNCWEWTTLGVGKLPEPIKPKTLN